MPWNVPILLTWLRILIIPIFTILFYLPTHWFSNPNLINWLAAGFFALAAITDWFDGYLARRWQQTSDFGAFLDPVADKLMVAVALILLVATNRTFALFAMIIIGREITISALREWMAQMGKRNSVAVAKIGKFKTTAQMAAIFLLLLTPSPLIGNSPEHTAWIWIIGNTLMAIACVLTLWSMLYYLKMAAKEFKA
ncbi:CDP-diacylglycerol--glycerol-3-phosphate 3-phosphatidyltransferase [Neisseriaceae bacterium ESL0693]|nr:CDP-diacylglycerol--glycerol-3-phosphate 3-phosphatidyltransferase [Neisseriaceae bacterium ESL0693]